MPYRSCKKGNRPKIIEVFGMHSMRDYDKFAQVNTIEIEHLRIIEQALGYMICKIEDRIENDTHTLLLDAY